MPGADDRPTDRLLTPYDEFPVHQTPRPFCEIPATDYAWDDGYFFGVYSADAEAFLFTGLRVSPNSDVVGAYAGICVAGIQHTVRLSRVWRPDFSTRVGPLSIGFTEPLERIHLAFLPEVGRPRFDLDWVALAPPFLEAHHQATSSGRKATDQSRYVQCGAPEGWIGFDGRRFEVEPGAWRGSRDHSWGLYEERKPLGGHAEHLPPPRTGGTRRALRFWMPFQTDRYTGFFHVHEGQDGSRENLNDVFGTPFEGRIDVLGEDPRRIRLVDAEHDLHFLAGTRALQRGVLTLKDEEGGVWEQEVELSAPPWFPLTIGYHQGSWSDGGTISTYHGAGDAGGVYIESDEFDLSSQPFEHTLYGGLTIPGMYGMEHCVRVRMTDPAG